MTKIDQQIVLYTIGCPQCNVLKKKLDMKGVSYTQNESKEEMKALGIDTLPVLSVNGNLLAFTEAMKWVAAQ